MSLIINILVNTIAVVVGAYIIPGVTVTSFTTAIVVAIVLGLLNAFVKPVLLILTLPINILTLGLFTFVINVLVIYITDALVAGFNVSGFLPALLFSFVISLVSSLFSSRS